MIQVNQTGSSSSALVSTMRDLGIDIPEPVSAEAKRYKESLNVRKTAENDYNAAVFAMGQASVDDVEAAQNRLIDAAVRLRVIIDGVETALVRIAGQRLDNSVFDAVPDWEVQVVDRFNDIVDQFELNEVAGDLPNFADAGSYNVLSLGRSQGHAVERWRTASEILRPLWHAYTKLASIKGYSVGAHTADNLADNLFSACVLGDPNTFGRTESAAHELVKLALNVDSVKAYAPIAPFVVPALSGYDLRLSSIADAAAIRSRVQQAA